MVDDISLIFISNTHHIPLIFAQNTPIKFQTFIYSQIVMVSLTEVLINHHVLTKE